jgi:Type II intron maturase/Reverse transcriptase (RNA-dependent DNA polymerase)
VTSPILSNSYLDRLDQFVEQSLLPCYNHAQRRQRDAAYQRVEFAIQRAKRHGAQETVRRLNLQRGTLPSQDPNDPNYRRLRYVRYADDWLLGFAGPKHEAEQIKSTIAAFLREELKLELSESKTLITHAASQAAHFLGYEIRTQFADDKITQHRRAVNARIGLFVPRQVIRQRCALYLSKGKPALRGAVLRDDDFTIVAKYQSEYRGAVQYYLLAQDVFRLGNLRWVMETSMLKTLAGKHRSTVTKTARKYKKVIETPDGPRTCFQVTVETDQGRKALVARFGGIPLKRQRTATLTDLRPVMASSKRNELIHRLLAECCEICTAPTNLEVHHVRKLADLNRPGQPDRPAWVHPALEHPHQTVRLDRHRRPDPGDGPTRPDQHQETRRQQREVKTPESRSN